VVLDFSGLIAEMKDWGIVFDDGLSETEMQHIENVSGVQFPPDYRAFLNHGLPIERLHEFGSRDFPNWRRNSLELLVHSREWLIDGILFDVRENNDWLEAWGERPLNVDEAVAVATQIYTTSPLLIPVYGHRFIASEPCKAGNPIYSVWGTDIICYGKDLATYLRVEFGNLEWSEETTNSSRRIRYWQELQYYNNHR
jgi:hypothetical protein